MSSATSTLPHGANAGPWNKTASSGSGGGGEYQLCPAGSHIAQITGLIHAGTVSNNFGESADTIILAYQLAKKQPDGQPFVLADKYTFSLNTKANFRKVVEAVEGRTLADGEQYDPRDLVGKVVLVNVKHSQSKDGTKTYHNLTGVSAMPEGLPAPDDSQFPIEPLVWSVLEGTAFPANAGEWLPWVYGVNAKTICENSEEFKARKAGLGSQFGPPPGKPGSEYRPPTGDDGEPAF